MRRFLVFFGLLIVAGRCFAVESGLDLRGLLRVDGYLYADINTNSGTLTNFPTYGGVDTLSLKIRNNDRGYAQFKALVDFYFFHGEFADRYLAALSTPPLGNMAFSLDIRKMYLKLRPDFGDISIGRQIVHFGEGFLFSPIDVFSTPDLTDVSFARRGSDILRITLPIGALGEFDVLSTLSTHLTNLNSALKISLNVFGWDTSLVGIYRYKNYETLAGMTFKGDLGSFLSLHGEGVMHVLSNGNDLYGEAVLGVDTSFLDGNLILMAEYYYNGRVVDASKVTAQNLGTIGRLWYARHYGFVQLQWLIDELTTVSANSVVNFPDEAWMALLQLNRSLYQNVNLSLWGRWYHKNLNNITWLEGHDLEAGIRAEVLF